MQLCLKAFSLELCIKPSLEEADDVGRRCSSTDVPEDLSHCFLQAGTEMVKCVLVVPV